MLLMDHLSCDMSTMGTSQLLFLLFLSSSRETLIRTAFQSLQLVVTDFLPIMPCYCLQISVETAARFGLQKEELNISLTAVGLLVSCWAAPHGMPLLYPADSCTIWLTVIWCNVEWCPLMANLPFFSGIHVILPFHTENTLEPCNCFHFFTVEYFRLFIPEQR